MLEGECDGKSIVFIEIIAVLEFIVFLEFIAFLEIEKGVIIIKINGKIKLIHWQKEY